MMFSSWVNPVSGVVQDSIDANGVWRLSLDSATRSDIPTTLFFASGTGDASGVAVDVGLSAFDGKAPVQISGAQKTITGISTAQDFLGVLFYPVGRIAITVSGLPGGTTLKAKVAQ